MNRSCAIEHKLFLVSALKYVKIPVWAFQLEKTDLEECLTSSTSWIMAANETDCQASYKNKVIKEIRSI